MHSLYDIYLCSQWNVESPSLPCFFTCPGSVNSGVFFVYSAHIYSKVKKSSKKNGSSKKTKKANQNETKEPEDKSTTSPENVTVIH